MSFASPFCRCSLAVFEPQPSSAAISSAWLHAADRSIPSQAQRRWIRADARLRQSPSDQFRPGCPSVSRLILARSILAKTRLSESAGHGSILKQRVAPPFTGAGCCNCDSVANAGCPEIRGRLPMAVETNLYNKYMLIIILLIITLYRIIYIDNIIMVKSNIGIPYFAGKKLSRFTGLSQSITNWLYTLQNHLIVISYYFKRNISTVWVASNWDVVTEWPPPFVRPGDWRRQITDTPDQYESTTTTKQ